MSLAKIASDRRGLFSHLIFCAELVATVALGNFRKSQVADMVSKVPLLRLQLVQTFTGLRLFTIGVLCIPQKANVVETDFAIIAEITQMFLAM